jgi:type I restriction enzyme S subunit
MITSVDVCFLKPAQDIDPAFLVYALSGSEYLAWLGGICRGGARDRVSRSMRGAIRVQKPPLPEQRVIAAFLDRETAKIDALVAFHRPASCAIYVDLRRSSVRSRDS